MKLPMKYINRILRALILLLAVSLITVALPLSTAAESLENAENSDSIYALFHYDQSNGHVSAYFPENDVLHNPCRKEYAPYDDHPSNRLFSLSTGHMLLYENRLKADGATYALYAEAYAGELLLLQNGDTAILLFTEEGSHRVEKLLQKDAYDIYRMFDYESNDSEPKVAHVEKSLMESVQHAITAGTGGMTMKLSELRYAPFYRVVGYDEDNTLIGALTGAFFRLDDTYYYMELLDSMLTTDGNINFNTDRTVTLYPIEDEQNEDMHRTVSHLSYNYIDYSFEEDIASTDPVIILILAVFFGMMLPAAPISVGLAKGFSQKNRGKRRWHLLTAMGGIWFVCGLLILLLMIAAL